MNIQPRFLRSIHTITIILSLSILTFSYPAEATQPPTPRPPIPPQSILAWGNITLTNSPEARFGHTAIWTGTEMIIWGGARSTSVVFNNGGRYNPVTDQWTPIPSEGAPAARTGHIAVWTGTEMIIWGGTSQAWIAQNILRDGARYNPVNGEWKTISPEGAPSARIASSTAAVWTGSELIIWGGRNETDYFNDGARYDPSNDKWTPIPGTGALSPRNLPAAVWTGTELIIWGGEDGHAFLGDGARYNPNTGKWTLLPVNNAPNARIANSAAWTGSEMIIWGGRAGYEIPADGARYNPTDDKWIPMSSENAPTLRTNHTAIWNGSGMIVWGGSSNVTGWLPFINDGGIYNPNSNEWKALPNSNAPTARILNTAIWTGSETIVWGGWDSDNLNNSTTLNNGASLNEYHNIVYLPLCAK